MTNQNILDEAVKSDRPKFIRVFDFDIASGDIPEYGVTSERLGGLYAHPLTNNPLRRLSYKLARRYADDISDSCRGLLAMRGRVETVPLAYSYKLVAQDNIIPDVVFDTTYVEEVDTDDYNDRATFYIECGVKKVYYLDWWKKEVHLFTESGVVEGISRIELDNGVVFDTELLFKEAETMLDHSILLHEILRDRHGKHSLDILWLLNAILQPMVGLERKPDILYLCEDFADLVDELGVCFCGEEELHAAVDRMRMFVARYDEVFAKGHFRTQKCATWLNPPYYLSKELRNAIRFVRSDRVYAFLCNVICRLLFSGCFTDESALGVALEECCGETPLSDTLYNGRVSEHAVDAEAMEVYGEILEMLSHSLSAEDTLTANEYIGYVLGKDVSGAEVVSGNKVYYYVELD